MGDLTAGLVKDTESGVGSSEGSGVNSGCVGSGCKGSGTERGMTFGAE